MCMFGDLLGFSTNRIKTEKIMPSVYLQGAVSDDGSTGMLLVADYRGDSSSLEIRIEGMDGAAVTAELLDQTHNRSVVPAVFAKGVLTLPKTAVGSAAFLVKFDKR